jgi:hypothetical protein
VKSRINQIRTNKAVPEAGLAPDQAQYDDLTPTMVAMVKKSKSNHYVKNIKLTPEYGLSYEGKFDIKTWIRFGRFFPGVW